MKTSRRAFLASLVAAVLGRALFRKPKPPAWVPGDGSLFNPRENLAAQYREDGLSIRVIRSWDAGRGQWITRMDALWGLQAQQNGRLTAECEVIEHRCRLAA